ncbi:hypothetical protein [Kribbella sp. NBC_00359]|uniref:hypothetical protein n=1 Tax=Kribbella sp. NBC_00359 TaxID=2975966 RepID=UPI002E1A84AF
MAQRTRVVDELRAAGWDVPDTQTNFVWPALGDDTAAFAEAVRAEGVSIRPFPGDGVQWPTTVSPASASPRSAADAIALREEERGLVDWTDTGRIPQYVRGLDGHDGGRLSAGHARADRVRGSSAAEQAAEDQGQGGADEVGGDAAG